MAKQAGALYFISSSWGLQAPIFLVWVVVFFSPPLSRTENKGQQNILVCFLDHLNYSIKRLEEKQGINVKKHQQEILILLLGLADEQSWSKLAIQRYIFGTEISPDYQALKEQ